MMYLSNQLLTQLLDIQGAYAFFGTFNYIRSFAHYSYPIGSPIYQPFRSKIKV
jgi:hypothetical protein